MSSCTWALHVDTLGWHFHWVPTDLARKGPCFLMHALVIPILIQSASANITPSPKVPCCHFSPQTPAQSQSNNPPQAQLLRLQVQHDRPRARISPSPTTGKHKKNALRITAPPHNRRSTDANLPYLTSLRAQTCISLFRCLVLASLPPTASVLRLRIHHRPTPTLRGIARRAKYRQRDIVRFSVVIPHEPTTPCDR